MKIILFSGKAEAGKTTAANTLKKILVEDNKRVAIIPYASYLKTVAKTVYEWNGTKDEKGRQLLQQLGTEIVRSKKPDFWVDVVINLADVLRDELDYILVDDCRFPNEVDRWYERCWTYKDIVTVRIERPGYENHLTPEQRLHPSETSLDDWAFHYVISAGNTIELEDKILWDLATHI